MSGTSRRAWVVRTGNSSFLARFLASAEARWQIAVLGPEKTGSGVWERPGGALGGGNGSGSDGSQVPGSSKRVSAPAGEADRKGGCTSLAQCHRRVLSRQLHRYFMHRGHRCEVNARSFTALGLGFWCHTGGRTSHKSPPLIPPELEAARRRTGEPLPGRGNTNSTHARGPPPPPPGTNQHNQPIAARRASPPPPKGGDISGAGPGGPPCCIPQSPGRLDAQHTVHRKGGEQRNQPATSDQHRFAAVPVTPPPAPRAARTANSQPRPCSCSYMPTQHSRHATLTRTERAFLSPADWTPSP